MEAPKKIYIDDHWNICQNNDSVEYTRTDVFIDNAEKYLKTQFIKDVSVLAGGPVNINFTTAIENFVNYMKGQ